jgi:hypothetical protein
VTKLVSKAQPESWILLAILDNGRTLEETVMVVPPEGKLNSKENNYRTENIVVENSLNRRKCLQFECFSNSIASL